VADRTVAAVNLPIILKHWLTSADGETYAVGRGLGLMLFGFGLAAPTVGFIMWPDKDLPDFLTSMVAYIPALSGSVAMLIGLTNHTEPKE
jgi:hypothetical protein